MILGDLDAEPSPAVPDSAKSSSIRDDAEKIADGNLHPSYIPCFNPDTYRSSVWHTSARTNISEIQG
jgi:hypothetical protein